MSVLILNIYSQPRHDITNILLKVALNTITPQTHCSKHEYKVESQYCFFDILQYCSVAKSILSRPFFFAISDG